MDLTTKYLLANGYIQIGEYFASDKLLLKMDFNCSDHMQFILQIRQEDKERKILRLVQKIISTTEKLKEVEKLFTALAEFK